MTLRVARVLPSGEVSFCFTDIEGSTRLFQQEPSRYPLLLAEHNAIVEAAVEAAGGAVIKSDGDAFFLAFDDPVAAVNACITAQRGLAGGELRVRMGVHTGHAEPSNDDYVAIAVHQAARVASAAHGGQIVVSASTAAAVGDAVALRDLGEYLLRDFDVPERIWQVDADGLAEAFPALRATAVIRHNLPRRRTPLVGREEAVHALSGAIGAGRLVTVVGTGGAGKTSVALATAAAVEDRHSDGVWLAEFAPLFDGSLVAAAVAQAVGVAEQGARMDVATLAERLADKAALVVLDNCEHVVDAAAELADAVLAACPGMSLLATSREALGVPGEQLFPLDALDDASAAQLFVDRARAVLPTFNPSGQAASHVAEIVRAADGLPLALELAAAKLGVMGIAELASELSDRLDLLGEGARVLPQRQRSVEALVRWSDDLLEPAERELFHRLAVFRGGFARAAAERVAGAEARWLRSLAAKSLLAVDERGRYRMLVPVWLYAREQLRESGEAARRERAHAEWCRELAAQAAQGIRTAAQLEWLDRVEAEQDNLRAALEWALAEDPVAALETATDVLEARAIRGHGGEARAQLFEAMAAAGDRDPLARARAGATWARATALYENDPRALEELRRAEAVFDAHGDEVGAASCMTGRAEILHHLAKDPRGAISLLEQAYSRVSAAGDRREEGQALLRMAGAYADLTEPEPAREFALRAGAIFRELGDSRLEAVALHSQSLAAGEARDFAGSLALGLEALEIFESLRDKRSVAVTLLAVAVSEVALGGLEAGRAHLAHSTRLLQEVEMTAHLYEWLDAAAWYCSASGSADAAQCLAAACSRHPDEHVTGLEQEIRQQVRASLPASERDAQGASLSDAQAMELLVRIFSRS